MRAAKTTAFMVGALLACYIPLIGKFDLIIISVVGGWVVISFWSYPNE